MAGPKAADMTLKMTATELSQTMTSSVLAGT